MSERAPRLFDATVRVDRLPATGKELHIEPSPEERAEIAEFLELTSLDALDADVAATKFRGD